MLPFDNRSRRSSPMPNVPPNPNVLPASIQQDLSKLLRQHDPSAQILLDFIPHVKVYRYNTIDLKWEANSFIEGTFFAYSKQNGENSMINAFIVISSHQHWIQTIDENLSFQVKQFRLFVQTIFNGLPEVFCLHFNQTHEPNRVEAFIQNSLTNRKSSIVRQATPVMFNQQKFSAPVVASPSPILSMNSNLNTMDSTISLKQMLKMPEPEPVSLLPPSAFAQAVAPPGFSTINRENIRQTLLYLVQNDDQFFDTIYQTYLHHRSIFR